jgi:hypothetical protein
VVVLEPLMELAEVPADAPPVPALVAVPALADMPAVPVPSLPVPASEHANAHRPDTMPRNEIPARRL